MTLENIIIINDFAHINGGASQVALAGALALSERDLCVTLFAAVGPIQSEIEKSKINVILLDQQEIAKDSNRLRAITKGIWNRKAAVEMAELLSVSDRSRTVVHLHIWVKSLSSSVIREIIKARFPLVVTLHDFFSVCPNGGLFNYQKNEICHLPPMSASCILSNCDKRSYSQKLWRVGRQVAQSKFSKMPSGVNDFVTISNLSENLLSKYLPQTTNFHRVRNPIFIDKHEAVNCARNSDFLFLGRLDPEKGVTLMARAASEIKAPTTFVGEGPMRQEIARILPSAKMTGWVTPEEVQGHINNARVLVFPSLWYETQGLTVLEAAARGIPAIVPDSSAAAEMVSDGTTGLVFKGGDRADLSAKMSQIYDNKLVERLGQAAYQSYWDDPATIEVHTNSLLELYSKILSRADSPVV